MAAVLKTARALTRSRGFESHTLRSTPSAPHPPLHTLRSTPSAPSPSDTVTRSTRSPSSEGMQDVGTEPRSGRPRTLHHRCDGPAGRVRGFLHPPSPDL